MKNLIVLLVFLTLLSCVAEREKKWKLIWSDEFDYTGFL